MRISRSARNTQPDARFDRSLRRWLGAAVACLFSLASAAQPSATPRLVRFREPHATRYHLLETNLVAGQSWTSARLAGGSTRRVELGSRVVLEVAPGTGIAPLLSSYGLKWSRAVRSNLFVLQAEDSRTAIQAAATLAQAEGVVACYPVMRRALGRHNAYAPAPNDSYFAEQWHLENRGSDGNLAGPDVDARAAWPFTVGDGILVAVADVGFQVDHPELTNRASGAPHFNFFSGIASGVPYASDANHATCVAGLLAAERDNQRGVAGVAPQAKLASWVVFGTSEFTGEETIASDEQLMDMFQYAADRVAVQNHSWGNVSTAQTGLEALADAGIATAVSSGRGGKGVVLVRAGGNDRDRLMNVNDDGYANDPRGIAVAAVRKDGRACSYSTPGACLLVAAPSGDLVDTNDDGVPDAEDPTAPNVLTTDRTGDLGFTGGTGDRADYTGFNGTSASSPQVAGVAALMLSVNSNLTYRDVQHILVHSARHYDRADPDLRENGAGFRFSHNVGFGVPDAGVAVALAGNWLPRPASQRVTLESSASQMIPDDALRVVCAGSGLSNSLTSIHCLPSFGPHADEATATLPLVYVGQANEELTVDLHGQAALIQRGVSFFSDKIARAARAGAAFAVIFNNTGTTQIQLMGGTDYVPIPAVSIGRSDGEALRDFLVAQPATTARLQLTPAVTTLSVASTLICEHVGVRLRTTHTSRADVRLTLVSPRGTRSVLQAMNTDTSAGPEDWTYWSAQHWGESSAGSWRVEVSDERNTTVFDPAFGTVPATGAVTFVQLILDGVAIADADADGLDDNWERHYFGGISYGPKDDPDRDGYSNAREQAMGTDPRSPQAAFILEVAHLSAAEWRLSWPARESAMYAVLTGDQPGPPWTPLTTNITGRLPVAEIVVQATNTAQFYRVQQLENP